MENKIFYYFKNMKVLPKLDNFIKIVHTQTNKLYNKKKLLVILLICIVMLICIKLYRSKHNERFTGNYKNKIYYTYWTGGFDSTFRICEMLINEHKTVQPLYITFNLDNSDILISYCNGTVVGSRYYNGVLTDVPAMGHDGERTINYCTNFDTPEFSVFDNETGRTIDLHGEDIPSWENLGIFRISLSEILVETAPYKTEIVSTFPNPFNTSTKINFNINKKQYVNLSIYDISGKLVEGLINEELSPGSHTISWNPNNISSGVYIVSLNTSSASLTDKVVYLK